MIISLVMCVERGKKTRETGQQPDPTPNLKTVHPPITQPTTNQQPQPPNRARASCWASAWAPASWSAPPCGSGSASSPKSTTRWGSGPKWRGYVPCVGGAVGVVGVVVCVSHAGGDRSNPVRQRTNSSMSIVPPTTPLHSPSPACPLTQPSHTNTPPMLHHQQLLELCKKLLKSGDWQYDEVLLLHDEAGTRFTAIYTHIRVIYICIHHIQGGVGMSVSAVGWAGGLWPSK